MLVSVLDLDARGCRVRGIAAAVTKTEPVAVWLGTVGPIAARLRWVRHASAGLAFNVPLDEISLEQARTSAGWTPPPRVIPLRRPLSDAGT